MQETGNFPSQPYQNSKGIHEVEAQKGESSMVKEVKTVITLSGKEADLPTCKLEHKEESETEKEKREEIKGKKRGKSTEKVSSEGCKLHMGSGQAKSGSNFLMDLVFLMTS